MDIASRPRPMQDQTPGNRSATPHPYTRARLNDLVRRIEEALRSGDRALQSQLVLQSAELLTKRWSRLPPPDKPAFDGLLVTLCDQIDRAARRAFAERLAPLRLGPPRTSQALARDASIDVAAPLLTGCSSLGDDLLAELAASGSDGHRRAIAARPTVTPAVTEVLLRHGDGRIAARLLDNPGARFSEAGFSDLTAHSERTEAVTLRLALRPDLPPPDRPALLDRTRRRAAEALVSDLGGDRAGADRLLAQAEETLARPVAEERLARFRASLDVIGGRFSGARRGPGASQLERWVTLNRIEDGLAAIAHAAGLPLAATVAAFDAPSPAPLAAILRGLDHPWPVTKALMTQRFGGTVPVGAAAEAWDLHRRLQPGTARRLIRFAAMPLRCAAFLPEADTAEPEDRP
ncbi:DUF2336 domain-containing protein [Methylorubrum podarium]|uniref:DUF2336 domain-containing protein n=1 Tax=Methylorubrum podarium TaxID=200476 RepID=UPI001EE21181|nr:DUF2336 domain-containing protein [Methylorubrum podarium]GJE70834.1 hypothetical protein CHKEEEPN_2376 [Methylorubrum podarium]